METKMTHDELSQQLQALEQEIDLVNDRKRQAILNYKLTTGLIAGAAVEYEGEVYFIFSSVYQRGFDDLWLTLTKLTKAGQMPTRPLQAKYTCAANCKLKGDEFNV